MTKFKCQNKFKLQISKPKFYHLPALPAGRCFDICHYFVICALIFVINSGCASKPKHSAQPPDSQKELEQAPEEMLSSFSLSGYTKGGQKQWDLEGKSADIMTEVIKLMNVTGKVYGKKTNMTIVADEGSLNRINNNVHLEKNVLATTDDGATLRTDYLDWDAQDQKLTSLAPVEIKRGLMQAQGKGLFAQPVLNLVQLENDVTLRLSLDKDQPKKDPNVSVPTVITCNGPLEVDYQKNLAIFHDNVKVKDARGEIFADKMDVYFTTQSEQSNEIQGMEGMGIDKVIATGNTEIHHRGNISYSEQAVYDTKTGKLTLTGQPKLLIYSTEAFTQVMGKAE